MRTRIALCLPAALAGMALMPAAAQERGANLVRNPGFEDDSVWEAVGGGFAYDSAVAHSGKRSVRVSGAGLEASSGLRQVIEFDPPVAHPFRVAGWSRAEGAEVGQDYSIYLDLFYDDGTPLWGQIASFEPGTHGWQRSQFDFDVARPVQRIEVFVLFRKAKGTVWFDDIEVCLRPFVLTGIELMPALFGGTSLGVTANATMPARWHMTIHGPGGLAAQQRGDGSRFRAIWAGPRTAAAGRYRVSLTARDDLRGEAVRETRELRLGAGGPDGPYRLWVQDSMVRVLPDSFPPSRPERPVARLSLAGNEYESFQLALLAPPGAGAEGLSIEVSDLTSRGGARIAASEIQWHQVGFVRADRLLGHPAYPEASPGWWPDPLLEVDQFSLEPGRTQAIWVTVHAPAGTPAGDYDGAIAIRQPGRPDTEVPVRVHVYGFDLPVQGHLKTAFALMEGYLERVYGRPLSAELRQRYGDFVLQHRLNPDDISRTDPPAIEDLLHYDSRGLNAFNVLNMVEPRGENAWVCWSPLEVYTPQFKQYLIDRLDPYMAQLREKGLADKAYVYTFDERGEEFNPVMREYFGMIHERYPGVPTLTTAYLPLDPEVLADVNVDWICPLTPRYTIAEADRCRAAGQQVWAYVCLGPRYPYANWLADFPLIESRVIWWQAYHQKMDGFLYWGLNIWDREHNDEPIDPSQGPNVEWSITTGGEYDWLHGDGRLLYAGPDGPIGSIRLANIRDGLEDYEYLWLLAEKAGDVETARKACLPVTTSLTSFTREASVVRAERDAVAAEIER